MNKSESGKKGKSKSPWNNSVIYARKIDKVDYKEYIQTQFHKVKRNFKVDK